MRQILLLAFLFLGVTGFAQRQAMGLGTTNSNVFVRGSLVLPKTTGSPDSAGSVRYNPSCTCVEVWDGTQWVRSDVEVTKNCPLAMDSIRTYMIMNGADSSFYYAFPTITATDSAGVYILGYLKGSGHATGGAAAYRFLSNYGKNMGPEILMESDTTQNYRNCLISNTGDGYLVATYWDEGGNLYLRTSTNNGVTWSSRQDISAGIGYDTAATENKVVNFKGKWIMPWYSYDPSATATGVMVSTNKGASWTRAIVPNPRGLLLNETGLAPSESGDSLIMFIRNQSYRDSIYRSTSFDGLTWTAPVAVNLPNAWDGRPTPYRLRDGRLVLNYRGYIENQTPGFVGLYAMSSDDGRNFTRVYDQPNWPGQFMYGSIDYVGGDLYISTLANDAFDDSNRTFCNIFIEYLKIQDCQLLLGGEEIQPIGNRLWWVARPPEGIDLSPPDWDEIENGPNNKLFIYDNTLTGATQNANFSLNGTGQAAYITAGTVPQLDQLNQFTVKGQQGVAAVHATTGRAIYLFITGDERQVLGAYNYVDSVELPIQIGDDTARTFINPEGGNVGVGTFTPSAKLHVNGRLRVDSFGTGSAYFLTLDSNNVLSKASDNTLGLPFTVELSTSDADPINAYVLTPSVAGHYRVEVVCQSMLADEGAYGAKKSRTFFFNGSTLSAGTLHTLEADEYLGSGLSSATFTINNVGNDINVQFTGEAATINTKFTIIITKIIQTP